MSSFKTFPSHCPIVPLSPFAIIALPSQLFYSTGIPVSLWFLSRHKEQPGKVLFIDARNMGTMVTRAVRELMQDEIKKQLDSIGLGIE